MISRNHIQQTTRLHEPADISKDSYFANSTVLIFQVVMPTVEADVAFGLGKSHLPDNEVKSRVAKALEAVGMSNYLQVVYLSRYL